LTVEFTRKVPDLIVMRHSKSAYPLGVSDHDRPLSARGVRDAQAARQWFAQQSFSVDQAWVSSALRAQQTWESVEPGVRSASRSDVEQITEPALYEATADLLLSLLQQCTASSLLLVAHNPGLEQLIARIVGRDAQGWLSHISLKYPTGAICVVTHDDWVSLGDGEAELATYAIPRASPPVEH
jgi:phosphohistidine phosphatase